MGFYRDTSNKTSTTLDELSLAFCGNVLLIESRFLGISWLSPRTMHDVACDVGLTAESFAYSSHSLMFAFLGSAVEEDILARISMNACAAIAEQRCLLIQPDRWIDDILSARDACDGDVTTELPQLARAVVSFGARREVAQTKLAEVARLLAGDPTDLDDVLRGSSACRPLEGAFLA